MVTRSSASTDTDQSTTDEVEKCLIREDVGQSYLTSDQRTWEEHCPRGVSDRLQIVIEIDLLGAIETEAIDISADGPDHNSQRTQPKASHATAHSTNRWTEQFRVFDRGRIKRKNMSALLG